MPENQTAWNSDNQGVKEIVTRPTAPQRSKEGCLTWVNTYGPTTLKHNRCTKTNKYDPNERTDQNCRKNVHPRMKKMIRIMFVWGNK